MESKISHVKKVVAGSAQGTDVSHKVKIPEPKSFSGARSAKELENFSVGYGAVFQGCTYFRW